MLLCTYDIINTNMLPNPFGFVIDVFIDIGVEQSRYAALHLWYNKFKTER